MVLNSGRIDRRDRALLPGPAFHIKISAKTNREKIDLSEKSAPALVVDDARTAQALASVAGADRDRGYAGADQKRTTGAVEHGGRLGIADQPARP